MSQYNKTCVHCSAVGHSGFYCPKKPRKPIKSTPKTLKAKKPAVNQETRSRLIKKLDRAFSEYYRQSQAIDGIVECYTCEKKMPWKQSQTGHFYTRGRQATRWSEDNVRIQCVGCNVMLNGNYITFTRKMLSEIGQPALDELEFLSLNGDKLSTPDMRELLQFYTKGL